MNNEEIKKLREEYKKIKKEQKKIKMLLEKLEELQQDDSVREYLSISDYLSKAKVIDEENYLFNARKKVNIKDANNIYVYIGSYEQLDYSWVVYKFVDNTSSKITHKKYYNIETSTTSVLPIEECADFEKDNIILYSKNENDEELNKKFAYKVKDVYYKRLIESGMEKAVKKVKSLNRK